MTATTLYSSTVCASRVADNFIWPTRSKIIWPSVWGMKKAGLLARPALAERERSV